MDSKVRKHRKRLTAVLMAALLCLFCVVELPGGGTTAQAATPTELSFFAVTITGGKGVAVESPDTNVDVRLYGTSFRCPMGDYVKLYYQPDPAPEFQKFDHWRVRVGVRVRNKTTGVDNDYFQEEDLTDIVFRPDLSFLTKTEMKEITLAIKANYNVEAYVTVRAIYVDNYWLVNFAPNGAEGEMDAVKVEKGQSYELPACPFTLEEHDFVGWKLGETVYQPGNSIEVTEDVTLEAQWQIKTYEVALATNASDWMGTISGGGTYDYGTEVTVTAAGKTYQDNEYGLLHWKDRETNEIVSRDASYSFVVTKNRSLLATFAVYTSMVFQPGGGTGTMDSAKVLVGEEYVLPECEFTKVGWRFAGWTIRNYEGVYPAGETFTVAYQHFLTATWEEIPEMAIPIDKAHFPDDAFREFIQSTVVNKNGDDVLSSGELVLTQINCSNLGIEDLTGIENFKEITALFCQNNQLTTLDLSGNKKLKEVSCYNNKLTSINLMGLDSLETLNAYGNDFETFELANMPNIKKINIYYCEKLKSISLTNVPKLSSLTMLYDTSLESFRLKDSLIASLALPSNCTLTTFDIQNCPSISVLTVSGCGLTNLDLSAFGNLYELNCSSNALTTLDLSNNPQLATLKCSDNDLTELNLSGQSQLTTLYVENNKLKELDLSKNSQLGSLYCSGNKLESLIFPTGDSFHLTTVVCKNNQLKELDVTTLSGLKELNVTNNELRNLDLTRNTKLFRLYCKQNLLTAIDISKTQHTLSNYILQVDDTVTVYRDETPDKCLMQLQASPAEGGRAYGSGRWIQGEMVSLLAEAKEGYGFVCWLEGEEDVSEVPVYEFPGAEDRELVAVFGKLHTVTVEGGTANKDVAAEGEKVTISAGTAPAGKVFDKWIVAGGGVTITNATSENASFVQGTKDAYVRAIWKNDTGVLTATVGHTCSFQNRIELNYKISANLSDYDDFWLAIERQSFTGSGEEYVWETTELREWYPDPDDGRYVYTFSDIAAAEMGEVILARVIAVKDGVTYESAVDEYSLKTYAYNRIKGSSNAKFRKLMVDMLNYGAAAQVYFGKNTGNLVNAGLTEDERKQGTQEEVTPVVIESVTDNVAETARIVSKSVAFKSGVELNAHVNYDAEPAEDEKVWVELTYVATSGDSKRQVVTRDKFVRSVKDGVVRYSAAFDIIATPDFGKEVTLKVFRTVEEDGVSTDVQISETYTYSLETYAANRLANSENKNFKALLREMLKYERSAVAYFTK